MNLQQLAAGLDAFVQGDHGNINNNATHRLFRIFLVAARNTILSEIGPPFVTFPVATGLSSNTMQVTLNAQTKEFSEEFNTYLDTAAKIRETETTLADIIAGQTGNLSSAERNILALYGITQNNPKVKTVNVDLNLNHAGKTMANLQELITAEAKRRVEVLNTVSNGQSTATADGSVQQSVRNLIARYGAASHTITAVQAAKDGLEAIIANAATPFVQMPTNANTPALPAARRTLTEQRADARAFLSISNSSTLGFVPSQHRVTGLTDISIEKVFAITWAAVHDRSSVLDPNQKSLPDTTQNSELISKTIAERERNLAAAFVELQNEYHARGPACLHGAYNKIVETLNMSHTDVAVLNQDLSVTVANEADRYIRTVVLSRVFRAQPNQQAIFEAFEALTPTNAQQTTLNNFKAVTRRALRGELAGQESLYFALRTRLCPLPFIAGQYTETRVLNNLIPEWLQNAYEYSGASLPQPRNIPVPLQDEDDQRRTRVAELRAANAQLLSALAGITAAYQQAEDRAAAAQTQLTQAQQATTRLQVASAELQSSLAGINAAYQQAEKRARETNAQADVLQRLKK